MADTDTAVSATSNAHARARANSRAYLIFFSALAGVIVAMLWSARLVDDDIGVNAANGMLGHNSLTTGINSSVAGIFFAFTAGLAGTFTACNVAAFSAIAPLMEDSPSVGTRARLALRPVGWLSLGAGVVAGVYGAIGAAVGTRIPQLSVATIGNTPVRTLQSVVVFSVIGLMFMYLGLAAAGAVPDPMARLTGRWRYTPQVVMGALIGGFLIGRPYPLFFKMFKYAASTHNPLYGAGALILVVIGNIVLMAVLFLLLAISRLSQWLAAKPGREVRFTAAALLIGGTFTLAYWGIRVPAHLGYGWFPSMPWH